MKSPHPPSARARRWFSFALCFFGILLVTYASTAFNVRMHADARRRGCGVERRACTRGCPLPVPVFGSRDDLGEILEREFPHGVGVELGVQKGYFAATTLQNWKNCSSYVLVDAWRNLANYHDVANHDDAMQESIMHEALESVAPWSDRIILCRNLTSNCAPVFPDASFDFVYVDARHDRLGVTEDLDMWWPKAKEGALFCGHDFVYQNEGPAQSGQRWDINADGSVDPTGGAVRGAVEDFAARKGRQLQVAYKEQYYWTWCMRR